MSKSSRKGSRGADEVVRLLLDVFPEARKRVNGEERQDENPGRDLVGTPGYCVQSQLAEITRPVSKAKEAIAAADDGEIPVAFTRASSRELVGESWFVTLRAEDFLLLVKSRQVLQEKNRSP